MRTLVVPLVGMKLLMTISGAFVLEELGAIFALERQMLGMTLEREREREEREISESDFIMRRVQQVFRLQSEL